MSNRILSYRGLLADGGQETILLSTKKGEKGYRITKFQLMAIDPNENIENAVKIYKDLQSSVSNDVDFSDNRLLGAGMIWSSTNQALIHENFIIFDNEIFNQDIYITNSSTVDAASINYYLELEVIKLDESQAMVATLKDIRNNS